MFPRPRLEISTTHHPPRGASALFTTNMTRARVGIYSHVQLQPRTLGRGFIQAGDPIAHAISSSASVILSNTTISNFTFAELDPPTPIVEKFDAEIGVLEILHRLPRHQSRAGIKESNDRQEPSWFCWTCGHG